MKYLLLTLSLLFISCGTEYRISKNSAMLEGYVVSEYNGHIDYHVYQVIESRGLNPSGIITIKLRSELTKNITGQQLKVIVREYNGIYITEEIN